MKVTSVPFTALFIGDNMSVWSGIVLLLKTDSS